MSSEPLVSAWITMPLAALTLIALAAHVAHLHSAPMPASRRRIRTMNGSVMLVTVPSLAVAVSWVSPHESRLFVLAWTACVALLGMMVVLAATDMVNNMRLYRSERVALKAEYRSRRLMISESRPSQPDGAGDEAT